MWHSEFRTRRRRVRSIVNPGTAAEVCEPRVLLTPSLALPSSPIDVSEDVPVNSVITSFGFTDADMISIAAGDDTGAFHIDVDMGQSTGTLKIIDTDAIDFETLAPSDPGDPDSDRLINLTIRADNLVSFEFVEEVLVLNVLDVDEDPVFGPLPPGETDWEFSVSEMALPEDDIGESPLTDPQGDALAINVYQGDLQNPSTWETSDHFYAEQDGDDAVIRVLDQTLDFEVQETHNLILEAVDGDGNKGVVQAFINLYDEPEWSGTGIFVGERRVGNSQHFHTTIVVIPTDQEAWKNDPRFAETVYIGRETYHYTTFSGHPENFFPPFGSLISTIAWADDEISILSEVGRLEVYMDQNVIISTLFSLDAGYSDDLTYHLFPENTNEVDYNSNSYVIGMLDALYLTQPVVYYSFDLEDDAHPGWQTPVPPEHFGWVGP